MSQALRFPVPSNSLLRFLRAQAKDAAITGSVWSPRFNQLRRHAIPSLTVTGAGTTSRRAFSRARTTHCLNERKFAYPSPECASKTENWRPSVRSRRPASPIIVYKASLKTSVHRSDQFGGDRSPPDPDTVNWQERLWGSAGPQGDRHFKSGNLPCRDEIDGDAMLRRTLSAKAALEPRLRCTEVDENGETTITDGEFKKTELIAKYGLLPRDLRKIDSSNLPHILIRPSAILLNLLHLKVLIKHDRVLLFDVFGSKTSYPQSAFLYDLQAKLRQKNTPGVGGLPYEFRALEAVLTSVTSELEADFEAVRDPVIRVLSELEDDIDRQKLRILLILSKRVSTFEQKAKLVRDAIDELLEADDDLADMYLTEKASDLYRGVEDHTEVEILLESYHKICDEIAQEASNLVSSIRNTEEIIRAILDANRNSLMLLELKFSIGTLGLAMGTFLAGLYGMNLENFIEETNWGFGGVTATSTFFSLVVCWYGLVKLRKVQRIKMLGDERATLPRSHQHWLSQSGTDSMLDPRSRERMRRMATQKQQPPKPKRWWWFW